ncbi:hypothetical protein NL676_036623 [Syzygium grande]|nr:hypothetical protein NL676_036623 [Syzygium grande]
MWCPSSDGGPNFRKHFSCGLPGREASRARHSCYTNDKLLSSRASPSQALPWQKINIGLFPTAASGQSQFQSDLQGVQVSSNSTSPCSWNFGQQILPLVSAAASFAALEDPAAAAAVAPTPSLLLGRYPCSHQANPDAGCSFGCIPCEAYPTTTSTSSEVAAIPDIRRPPVVSCCCSTASEDRLSLLSLNRASSFSTAAAVPQGVAARRRSVGHRLPLIAIRNPDPQV